MMKTPPYLSKGSKLAIVAPARKVVENELASALEWIREKEFISVYDERLFAEYHQFAGDDNFRASVLQDYLDRDDIDAILCARGGYGTIRIIDKLNFNKFKKRPKWIIGYSDITILHAKIQQLGYESIHATMPINFSNNTPEALATLYAALTGQSLNYKTNRYYLNKEGVVEAEVVGGNISTLYSLLGSDLFPDIEGKILFIEDLDEYLYHIDRMLMAFQRSGKLEKLAGLIIGGLTDMHDNEVPFGQNAKEIIAKKISSYNFPVCFNFPAGHINDNRAIILGRKTKLDMTRLTGGLIKQDL